MCADMLECAAALEQIHTVVGRYFGPQRPLARGAFPARATIAQTRDKRALGAPPQLRLASRDALTLLPKRDVFCARLQYALARPALRREAFAVLHLEVDGFQQINEEYGYGVGDALLKVVAARLCRTVRTTDMVSRFDNDEFACLISSAPNRDELSHRAFELFAAVSTPCRVGALELVVRPSIGIAVCPIDGATTDALLRNAAAAQRRARRHEAGYTFYDPQVDASD